MASGENEAPSVGQQLKDWASTPGQYTQVEEKTESNGRVFTRLTNHTQKPEKKSDVATVLATVKKKLETARKNSPLGDSDLSSIYVKCKKIYDTTIQQGNAKPKGLFGTIVWNFQKLALAWHFRGIEKLTCRPQGHASSEDKVNSIAGAQIKSPASAKYIQAYVTIIELIRSDPEEFSRVKSSTRDTEIAKGPDELQGTMRKSISGFGTTIEISGGMKIPADRKKAEEDLKKMQVKQDKLEEENIAHISELIFPTQKECEEKIIDALRKNPGKFVGLQLEAGRILTIDTDDGRRWGIDSLDAKGSKFSFVQVDENGKSVQEALSTKEPRISNDVHEQITKMLSNENYFPSPEKPE